MDQKTRTELARALLGQGEVRKQGDNMRLDPLYQQHVIESQTSGGQTLSRDQWTKQYMDQGAKPYLLSK